MDSKQSQKFDKGSTHFKDQDSFSNAEVHLQSTQDMKATSIANEDATTEKKASKNKKRKLKSKQKKQTKQQQQQEENYQNRKGDVKVANANAIDKRTELQQTEVKIFDREDQYYAGSEAKTVRKQDLQFRQYAKDLYGCKSQHSDTDSQQITNSRTSFEQQSESEDDEQLQTYSHDRMQHLHKLDPELNLSEGIDTNEMVKLTDRTQNSVTDQPIVDVTMKGIDAVVISHHMKPGIHGQQGHPYSLSDGDLQFVNSTLPNQRTPISADILLAMQKPEPTEILDFEEDMLNYQQEFLAESIQQELNNDVDQVYQNYHLQQEFIIAQKISDNYREDQKDIAFQRDQMIQLVKVQRKQARKDEKIAKQLKLKTIAQDQRIEELSSQLLKLQELLVSNIATGPPLDSRVKVKLQFDT